jgi:putative ABC transport system permease protein
MFRRRTENDFSAEIRAHIALEAERLRAEGLSQADAEAAARRAFGNPTAAEERFYESSRWMWWDQMSRDSRYALRMLRRSPAFTIAAVLTLALGIGANTAIFSVIDAALLRPLPYPQPDRLVMLYGRAQAQENSELSPATFLDFRRQSRALDLAGYRQSPFNVTGQDRPERIAGAVVTPDFFGVLGIRAQLGRTLTPELDKPGSPRTVVLSYALWQRRYGASPEVLGRQIVLDGEPRTVVGVMPPFFQYPPESDLWTAARFAVPEHILRPGLDQSNVRDSHYFDTIGRLRPGVSLAQAQAEANTIARRLKQQYGSDEEASSAALVTLRDDLIGEARPALMILLGAVGLLLAIACANVANILLARGAARQKEIAVRAALGAGRARLVRQFLTESILLAVAGGGLGIGLAYAGLRPLHALLQEDVLAHAALRLDTRVLVFTTLISLASGILFGLFPALHLSGSRALGGTLKEGGRGSSGGVRAHRTRSVLVATEVALAAVLLVGAGLLIRSFSRLLGVSEGFRAERVLSLRLSLPEARYPAPGDRARFVTRTLESIAVLPGVASTAVVSRLPLNPGNSTRSVDIKGRTSTAEDPAPDYLVTSPDYFRSMGIRLLSGRAFTERDDASAPPVVIVSQSMARTFWPGRNPLGEFVTVGGCGKENEWCQVVGVVEDVHQHNLDQTPRPAIYVPYARDPWPFMAFVIRTRTEPAAAASAVQSAVHSVDRDQPLYGVRTMEEVVSASRSPRRVRMLLLSLFAALALALACVGIYGVMAYLVAQRTHEIGIRMALGADRKEVLALIVGQGLKLSVAGVAAGLLLAVGLSRFLSTVLYGVGTTDAATFAGVGALLIALAAAASCLPAWRASRVDPVTALRAQ